MPSGSVCFGLHRLGCTKGLVSDAPSPSSSGLQYDVLFPLTLPSWEWLSHVDFSEMCSGSLWSTVTFPAALFLGCLTIMCSGSRGNWSVCSLRLTGLGGFNAPMGR